VVRWQRFVIVDRLQQYLALSLVYSL